MAFKGSSAEAEGPKQLDAWSFSRWKTWAQCPFKLKCSAIDKLPEPESEAILEGHRIHKAAQFYLEGKAKDVVEDLAKFASTLEDMKGAGATAEARFALDKDLKPTDWFRGAWLRVIYDVMIDNGDSTLYIGDWKTGRPRDEDREQLGLFALSAMLLHPETHTVYTELLYTKSGRSVKQTFIRADLEGLKDFWLKRGSNVVNEIEFLPTPNQLCKWCHYRKDNGGPCKY